MKIRVALGERGRKGPVDRCAVSGRDQPSVVPAVRATPASWAPFVSILPPMAQGRLGDHRAETLFSSHASDSLAFTQTRPASSFC